MDRAIHSRCRIEAMTEVRFFLILFPIKPYVRRNIEKEQKKALKTDMLNNQFKPSGGGSGDIKPQGRNLNKFRPLKKEIRGMY